MKKLLALLCLMIFTFGYSQEILKSETLKNEIKINTLFLVLGAVEVTYENLLNKDTGLGISLFVVNEEDFDTAGNYDPTTNFRFTPTTAGYYQFNYEGQIVGTEGQLMTIALYKNGASYHSGSAVDISGQGYGQVSSSDLVYMNGSSDYVEVYLYTSASGANIGGNATGNVSVFSGVWIRS